MRNAKLAVVMVCGLSVGLVAQQSDKQIFSSGGNFPVSSAIRVGGFVYLSGMLARDFSGDIQSQTREALERIGETLTEAGSSLGNVASTTIFLKNAADFPAMNEVYGEFFTEDAPARTTVMVDLALPTALIEIAVTAIPNGGERKVILPEGWVAPTSPYNYGIQSGDTLFLAGLVSRNGRDNSLIEGQIGTEVETIMSNAGQILGAAGMDHGDIVSARVYLRDRTEFQDMNAAWRPNFPQDPPTRAALITGLPGSYGVEMQFVAVKGSDAKDVIIPPRADGSPGRPGTTLSAAIRVGNRLWVSGALGVTNDNHEDIGSQTELVFERLGQRLDVAGFEWSDVVAVDVYVTDMQYYAGMNEAYRKQFTSDYPVRATVRTGLANPNGIVEIAVLAVK